MKLPNRNFLQIEKSESMEKVIISGADGFIGYHFMKCLMRENVQVWAILHPKSQNKKKVYSLKEIHCIECEIHELKLYSEHFPKAADAFFHFAWQGVNSMERDDMELQLKNIDLCLDAIRFASAIGVHKFILPGSTSEYLYYGKPINESALPSPQNSYGSVKVAVRYLAEQFAKQCKINFIYVVITGIYAADRKDNNVIFYVIDKLLHQEKPSVTKLEQLWDYVNIQDVVEALTLIGDKGQAGAFYTIGHGDNQPLYQYIEEIHQYIDPTLSIGIGEVPYANDRLPSSCVDLTRLYEDTGFVPKVSFESGIKKVIDRMKKEITDEK